MGGADQGERRERELSHAQPTKNERPGIARPFFVEPYRHAPTNSPSSAICMSTICWVPIQPLVAIVAV